MNTKQKLLRQTSSYSICIVLLKVLQINSLHAVSERRESNRKLTVRQELHLARTIGALFGCFAAAYIPFVTFTFVTILKKDIEINRFIR